MLAALAPRFGERSLEWTPYLHGELGLEPDVERVAIEQVRGVRLGRPIFATGALAEPLRLENPSAIVPGDGSRTCSTAAASPAPGRSARPAGPRTRAATAAVGPLRAEVVGGGRVATTTTSARRASQPAIRRADAPARRRGRRAPASATTARVAGIRAGSISGMPDVARRGSVRPG